MFSQWLKLNESATFSVEGYDKPEQVHDIDQLANYLKTRLYKIPEFASGTNPNLISADGYTTGPKGTLNFYPAGINESKIQTILNGIQYYLDELHVKHGNWRKNTSGMFKDEDVYRIDVEIAASKKQYVPEINMSNEMAEHLLRNVLGVRIQNVNDASLDARDLLIKIDNITDWQIKSNVVEPTIEKGKANIIGGGMDEQRIKKNLKALENLCRWAVNNGYQNIQLS